METTNARAVHLPIRARAKSPLRRRRMSRRRVIEREIPLTLVPTADRHDEAKVGITEKWRAMNRR